MVDGSGAIDFVEMMSHFSLRSPQFDRNEIVEFAFNAYAVQPLNVQPPAASEEAASTRSVTDGSSDGSSDESSAADARYINHEGLTKLAQLSDQVRQQ
jgi:hypothetical protein